MPGPLEGIVVVDLTVGLAGPYATATLGDMGAKVIKIEDVPNGDSTRGTRTDASGILPPSDINYVFECANRNKMSVAVNLRNSNGRDIVCRLVERSDVFVSNLRTNRLEKWGLVYESLSKLNPRIIYALVSGYGPKGPDRDQPAYDLAAQARGGLLSAIGEADALPPAWGVPWLADMLGGMLLIQGIGLALFMRERTGVGQEVHTSLLAGQLGAGYCLMNAYLFTGRQPLRLTRKTASNPLRNSYQGADGKWLSLNMTISDRYWPDFCKALGMTELEDNPRFKSDQKRTENKVELISLLDQVFASKPRDEWVATLARNGIVCGPVLDYAEVAVDPQVVANEYITSFEHPARGLVREVGSLVQFSKSTGMSRNLAPEYAQHTEEVLLELGYSWEDIGRLKQEQTII